ncbi:unnamed protein product [Closterium sp. Naga37s-1]|nr:unnamed protein product [Closterium sp. Naga37s-1]
MADAKPQTLRTWLHSAVESRGDAAAIVVTQGGPTVTHGALEAAVDAVAAQLRALGVRPGDLVSLAFPNSLEFVILFLAVTRVRATAAPLNAAYTEEEFKFYMEDAQARLLLLPEGGTPKAQAAAAALGVPVAHAGSYGGEEGVPLRPSPGVAALPPADIPDGPGPGPTPDPADVALFLHTSGTTSRPKGVPLTHANLAASIGNIIDTYDLTPADRSYLVMPLFHVHGLMAALLASLSSGGSVVLPASGRFSASTFWDEVVQSGATWYTAVPTMHQILLSRHRSHGPPTLSGKPQENSQVESQGESPAPVAAYPPLRFIRSCSASLAAAVLEEMETVFGAPVLEAYAMTEASHQMTANPLPSKGPHKAGSVGVPTGIELAILDEQGRELGVGERGEVCIRGANVTAGYRSNPAANEAAFAFGWFHTGDEGKRDEEGYVYLTGRLKELINRGGEKISPLEVDAALLAVTGVAEAVAFSAPDDHYGEEVNAAVVLEPGVSLTQEEVQEHLKNHLAAFKLPKRVFFVDHLPRTATGKIQRRFVAQAMLTGEAAAAAPAAASAAPTSAAAAPSPSPSTTLDAPALIALSLARLGVTHLFGVIGIPVTAVATAAQQQGIRFLSFRNEQAAGYAAAAYGYLTGTPGVLLTVSGPGCVHALAGVSHAQVNTWPLLLLSGSCTQEDVGQGDFQELDQVGVVRPFVKESGRAKTIAEIPGVVKRAAEATVAGRPGAAYVDLPADVLHGSISEEDARKLLEDVKPLVPLWRTALDPSAPLATALESSITEAIGLLREAKAPLLVVGKGAAYAHAEKQLAALVEATGIPFLPTPMGKGVLSDSHPLCVSAARSLALSQADVALLVGARLNWILHFGHPPKWAAGVKFVLVDVDESEVAQRRPAVGLVGDARAVVGRLAARWAAEGGQKLPVDNPWVAKLNNRAAPFLAPLSTHSPRPTILSYLLLPSAQAKASANSIKMESLLSQDAHPLNFHCSLRVLRDKLAALPPSVTTLLCSEGANTMDMGRTVLPQLTPRSRLDAATWGTMGVGLGYAVAAAVAPLGEEGESGGRGSWSEGGKKEGRGERLVVALEGDSAFGFSGMEIEVSGWKRGKVSHRRSVKGRVRGREGQWKEGRRGSGGVGGGQRVWTMVRYNLPIVVIVMNNGGIYGGDRRGPVTLPNSTRSDPPPTSFVEGARYDRMMEAFGGRGYHVTTVQELGAALEQAFGERRPAVVNVVVDPLAGAESGRLTHKN